MSTSCSSPGASGKFWEASNYTFRPVSRRPSCPAGTAALRLAEAGIKPFNVQPLIPYLKRVGTSRANESCNISSRPTSISKAPAATAIAYHGATPAATRREGVIRFHSLAPASGIYPRSQPQ